MDELSLQYDEILRKITRSHFQVKSKIQNIVECRKSIEKLTELNEIGRAKISEVRQGIENLEMLGRETNDEKILAEVDSQRQLLSSTLKLFKEANITSLLAVERAQRDELIKPLNEGDGKLRKRNKVDTSGLIQQSSGVTEQLLSISRKLAETTQQSQDTLDNLLISSSAVKGTRNELENTAGKISQSSKLLQKYGRREFTDKVIMFFAFLFFITCVLYVLQKRLF